MSICLAKILVARLILMKTFGLWAYDDHPICASLLDENCIVYVGYVLSIEITHDRRFFGKERALLAWLTDGIPKADCQGDLGESRVV